MARKKKPKWSSDAWHAAIQAAKKKPKRKPAKPKPKPVKRVQKKRR